MSLNSLIPQLWAASILENLNDVAVFKQCLNTDYQENLRVGDSVRINSIGRVTIGTYTKNTWTLTPEVLDSASQTLVIDQQKYFYVGIDDIDTKMQNPKVRAEFMQEAGWGLADTQDSFLATTLSAGVATGNTLTAATVGSGAGDSDPYEIIVDLRVKLDVLNTPKAGRWLVVPPWYVGELLKDPRFVSFGTSENLGRAMQGAIKTMSGFDIYVSNNCPVSGSAYTLLAGYKGAATMAESIPDSNFESFRHPDGFVDVVRGLHVYGAKVTRPDNLAKIAVTQG